MITLRPSQERGHFNYEWLDTYHTFSFSDYHEPRHMAFRTLRVINEDRVAPGQGFATHSHRDMEILTYILSGQLQHRDSMGNTSIIRAGEIQKMSAGSGVTHSEFNPSETEPVHLLQIWIFPHQRDLTPEYDQKKLDPAKKKNKWRLLASDHPDAGSVLLHQDAKIFDAALEKGKTLDYKLDAKRGVWVQVTSGTLSVAGKEMREGDGAKIEKETALQFQSPTGCDFLLFDLA